MRTFADALREARGEADRPMGRGVAMSTVAADDHEGEAPLPPLEALEARIVASTGPVDPANPRAHCDYCPRRQSADMLVEVEAGRYACDGCLTQWARERQR
jgi:hypothetical protein